MYWIGGNLYMEITNENLQNVQHYADILKVLEEERQVLDELQASPKPEVDKTKSFLTNLVEMFSRFKIVGVNSFKNMVHTVGTFIDNKIKEQKAKLSGGVINRYKTMFKLVGGGLVVVRLITIVTKAIQYAANFVIGVASALKPFFSSKILNYLGLCAVLFFFGWALFKVYKKIVEKAKQSTAQPTTEDINKIFNVNNILTESEYEVQDESVQRGIIKVKDQVKLCQDALDVLAILGIGGLLWSTFIVALTPLMIVAIIGSLVWLGLLLTRNQLQYKRSEYQQN